MEKELTKKEAFNHWLINNKGVSPRVASNYISRCKRIQKEFNINLLSETQTIEKFNKLTIKINIYSRKKSTSTKSAYALSGNLISAVRKYAIFIHDHDEIKLKYIRESRGVATTLT